MYRNTNSIILKYELLGGGKKMLSLWRWVSFLIVFVR